MSTSFRFEAGVDKPIDQYPIALSALTLLVGHQEEHPACKIDPVVDRWSRSKIGQVELIEKSSTSRSSRLSRVDFSTSRVDRLVDD